jgi:hypothetical protein
MGIAVDEAKIRRYALGAKGPVCAS